MLCSTPHAHSFRVVDSALTTLGKSKGALSVVGEVTLGVKRKGEDEDVDDQNADGQNADGQNADGVAEVAEAPTEPNSHQSYNTRFKGVKRVKLGREVPEGFPYTPQRRGRPRKSVPSAVSRRTMIDTKTKTDWPKNPSSGRPHTSLFDGVEVVMRSPLKRASLDNAAASHDPDADAEGDMDGDVEGIVWPQPQDSNVFSQVTDQNDHPDSLVSNQGDS